MKIVIIDYKMGNTQSIQNALSFLGYTAIISHNYDEREDADALILPGVGAFHQAMHNLQELHLIEPLERHVIKKKKPILGICLGMQILAKSSSEIEITEGLNWIDAKVQQIPSTELSIPHVGWNSIEVRKDNPLFKNISSDTHFYFDHSFHFMARNKDISSTTLYGQEIVASIQKENIFATQFHPEKSQSAGLKLLRNFLNYVEDNRC